MPGCGPIKERGNGNKEKGSLKRRSAETWKREVTLRKCMRKRREQKKKMNRAQIIKISNENYLLFSRTIIVLSFFSYSFTGFYFFFSALVYSNPDTSFLTSFIPSNPGYHNQIQRYTDNTFSPFLEIFQSFGK